MSALTERGVGEQRGARTPRCIQVGASHIPMDWTWQTGFIRHNRGNLAVQNEGRPSTDRPSLVGFGQLTSGSRTVIVPSLTASAMLSCSFGHPSFNAVDCPDAIASLKVWQRSAGSEVH